MLPQTTSTHFPSKSKQSLLLRFFDQTIEFKSHSAYLHTTLGHMYRRFQVSPLQVSDTSSDEAKTPQVVIEQWPDKQQHNSSEHEFSIFEVSRLQRAYTTHVRTHLLIHAGALSYANQGILLVAPSMHGKTTLTLKLLHDGFKFLSDDIAPLGLDSSLLYPFPRSFVIRSGSVKLAGFSPRPAETPTWLGKQIVDAETLRPDCISQPVPIRQIFFLHGEAENSEQDLAQQETDKTYKVLVTSLPDALQNELLTIKEIEQLAVDQLDGQIRLHITAKNRLSALQQLEVRCANYDVEVTHLGESPPQKRSFKDPAQLTKISNSQAVVHLLDQFFGGYHSALFQNEMQNSPIKLSMTLARMIQNADCYMLRVGPLEEIADLVKKSVQ